MYSLINEIIIVKLIIINLKKIYISVKNNFFYIKISIIKSERRFNDIMLLLLSLENMIMFIKNIKLKFNM